ncbi:MAG TPA: ParA family protein [Casimicrobiaceae bacterium]|nr:ParA family protein [Casimicrobiaceae bacterium]
MRTIVVANPKGGSGKTTLATNIAGWLAGKRQAVALADFDAQQSASEWLARRPSLFPAIARWDPQAKRGSAERSPQWLVVDTPAGVHTEALREVLKRADVMLMPVSPSAYDMAASQRFLDALADYKAIKQGSLPLGLVGMRVDARTHSAAELDEYMRGTELPVVAHLRDTQVYVYCARDGASVFDLPRSRAEQDWDQWRPLTRWISRQALANREAA